MIRKPFSLKTKQIIIVSLAILFWQFTFPQAAKADEQIGIQNDPLIQAFHEQWSVSLNEADIPPRLPENPDRPQPEAKKVLRISVTAYSSTVDQCGADPFTTAAGTEVRDGVIAVNFLPIGTQVRFPEHFGSKIFVVEDRMSSRYWQRADIWMPSREQAKEWGIKYTTIEIL